MTLELRFKPKLFLLCACSLYLISASSEINTLHCIKVALNVNNGPLTLIIYYFNFDMKKQKVQGLLSLLYKEKRHRIIVVTF